MKKTRLVFAALAVVGLAGVVATSYTPPTGGGGPELTAALGTVPSCCANKGDATPDSEATLASSESGGCCPRTGMSATAVAGVGNCEEKNCASEGAGVKFASAESDGCCPFGRQTATSLVSAESEAGCREACGTCPSANADAKLVSQEKACGEGCGVCPLADVAGTGCAKECDDLPLPEQAAVAVADKECEGCPHKKKTEATLASQTSKATGEGKQCDACPQAAQAACGEKCCSECPTAKKTAAKLAGQQLEQKPCAAEKKCSATKSCCPSEAEERPSEAKDKGQKQVDRQPESGDKLAAE